MGQISVRTKFMLRQGELHVNRTEVQRVKLQGVEGLKWTRNPEA